MLKNSLGICIQIVLMLPCLFLHGLAAIWGRPSLGQSGCALKLPYGLHDQLLSNFWCQTNEQQWFLQDTTLSAGRLSSPPGDHISVPKVSPNAPPGVVSLIWAASQEIIPLNLWPQVSSDSGWLPSPIWGWNSDPGCPLGGAVSGRHMLLHLSWQSPAKC